MFLGWGPLLPITIAGTLLLGILWPVCVVYDRGRDGAILDGGKSAFPLGLTGLSNLPLSPFLGSGLDWIPFVLCALL